MSWLQERFLLAALGSSAVVVATGMAEAGFHWAWYGTLYVFGLSVMIRAFYELFRRMGGGK